MGGFAQITRKQTQQKNWKQILSLRENNHLFAGLTLPHSVLQVDEPGPVEDEGGDREDEVEGQVGPAGVLAAVHQDQVADQEGQAQHDVHISEIIFMRESTSDRMVNSELL